MQNNKTSVLRKIADKLTRVLPFLFWALLLLGFDKPSVACLTAAAALLHEAAHAIFAFYLGGYTLRARTYGFALTPKRTLSYREEIAVAAAGPAANIAVFVLLAPLAARFGGGIAAFGILNLLTALSNLLPIRSYDGYRIIDAASKTVLKPELAERIMNVLSTSLLFILTVLSLYLVLRLDTGYFPTVTLLFLLIKNLSCGSSQQFARKREKKRVFKRFKEVSKRKT